MPRPCAVDSRQRNEAQAHVGPPNENGVGPLQRHGCERLAIGHL
jgi:hypothetical protein